MANDTLLGYLHKWIYFPGVGWLLSIFEDPIGNDRNIANCVQVVINAWSFLLATAELFVQSSRSLALSRSKCHVRWMVYLISLAHKSYILADNEDITFYNQGSEAFTDI